MLSKLYIKDFAIIDSLNLDFNDGFSAISGETGSGKSIIVDALAVVLGAKASKNQIRDGFDSSSIEAHIDIDNKKLAKVNSILNAKIKSPLILKRIIYRDKPSENYINDISVSLKDLSEISALSINILGQKEQFTLLDKNEHINILDYFGDNAYKTLLKEINELYLKIEKSNKRLKELPKDQKDIDNQIDFIEFQKNEIDEAEILDGEDEELETEIKRLNSSEDIKKTAYSINQMLRDSDNYSVDSILSDASNLVDDLKEYSKDAEAWYEKLMDYQELIKDINEEIKYFSDSIDYDQERLYELSKRLDEINKIKYKYGNSIAEINAYREDLNNKLNEIRNIEQEKAALEKSLIEDKKSYDEKASDLSLKRKALAKTIAKMLEDELRTLNMSNIQVEISVEAKKAMKDYGYDDVEILMSANKGQSVKPISEIISGGEMSRLMLAIKNLGADFDNIDTIIFDEIDAGLSGYTASCLANKLRELANKYQIISISHLPQILAKAEEHYLVEKASDSEATISHVKKLDYDGRVIELARLLSSGKISDIAIKNAKELLKSED
ncbi:DNA repair protein RecN [uncultured Fenollaria sp.]|uniref:DNA repair protein RecN n=1 Tax=uncultured Fenollaria sp. TaxID=1686315 RepID=UPI0025DBC6E7|nr:DNA repair protein RecN [uncultured Fenollaria sp.]